MTNKMTIAASEVCVNDHIYNGTGTNAYPTFAWETVTEAHAEDVAAAQTGGPPS